MRETERDRDRKRKREAERERALKFFRTEKNCNSLVLFFSFSSLPLFGPCKLCCHTKTQTEVHTNTCTAHMHTCVCVITWLPCLIVHLLCLSLVGFLCYAQVILTAQSFMALVDKRPWQPSLPTFPLPPPLHLLLVECQIVTT